MNNCWWFESLLPLACLLNIHANFHCLNWSAANIWIFITQLVEHCSANAGAIGSNPVEGLQCFFGLELQLRWSHLNLICIPAVQINFIKRYTTKNYFNPVRSLAYFLIWNLFLRLLQNLITWNKLPQLPILICLIVPCGSRNSTGPSGFMPLAITSTVQSWRLCWLNTLKLNIRLIYFSLNKFLRGR